jgi:hypothetical protein
MIAVADGDLTPEEPGCLLRGDGRFLLYKGRVNSIIGEPGGGKSWVAMLAALQVLNDGGGVMILDFEDTAKSIANRLLALGMTKDKFARLGYANPDGPPTSDAMDDIARDMQRIQPDLIIVDGVNAAMTLMGLELKENTDANKFHHALLKPLTKSDATIITVDHVAKSRESRNGYAIGAQAKKAMADGVVIDVRAKRKFGKGTIGSVELFLQKDKHGGVQGLTKPKGNAGDYLATFVLNAQDPTKVSAELYFDDKDDEVDSNGIPKGQQRIITKMIEVSQFLASHDPEKKGLSLSFIEKRVPGNSGNVRGALTQLVETHHVTIKDGPRNAKLHVLVSPYNGVDPVQTDPNLKLIMGEGGGAEEEAEK